MAAAALLLSAVSLCGWVWQLNDYGVVRLRTRTARSIRVDDTDPAHEHRAGLHAPGHQLAIGLPGGVEPASDAADGPAPGAAAVARPQFQNRRSVFRFSRQERSTPDGRSHSATPRGPPFLS